MKKILISISLVLIVLFVNAQNYTRQLNGQYYDSLACEFVFYTIMIDSTRQYIMKYIEQGDKIIIEQFYNRELEERRIIDIEKLKLNEL